VVQERAEHSPSEEEISDLEDIRRKNVFGRLFRPMGAGSIRSSIMTLVSGCAGVGMLGLPKVMSYFGVTFGVTLFVVCGGFAHMSITILCEAMQISGKRKYPNIVSFFLGKVNFLGLKCNRRLGEYFRRFSLGCIYRLWFFMWSHSGIWCSMLFTNTKCFLRIWTLRIQIIFL
jgi:hypothetical protein